MPPRNRQQSAYKAASTAGGYKASLYDISDASGKMDFAKRQGAWEEEKVGRKMTAISDTLGLASTAAEGMKDTQVLEEDYIPELEKSRFAKEYKGKLSFEEFKTQDPGEYTKQFETHEIERNMWERITGKERMYQFGSGDEAREFKSSSLMAYGKQAKGLADYKALGMEDYFGLEDGGIPTLAQEAKVTGAQTPAKPPANPPAQPPAQSPPYSPLVPHSPLADPQGITTSYKEGKGLTSEANKKLYGEDPSMRGQPPGARVKRYEELFGEKEDPYSSILGEYDSLTNPLGIK